MGTRKQEVSCVNNFPTDIWAYVVPYLNGEQLGRLKMTGNALLWAKLTRCGVVKSVDVGGDLFPFHSRLAFLNDFSSLSDLSMHVFDHAQWSAFKISLDSLPPSLIILSCISCLPIPSEHGSNIFIGKNGESLRLCDRLPRLEVLFFGNIKFSDLTWMKWSPSSLKKLRISDWDGQVPLPASLIHFEASLVMLRNFSSEFQLPPGLEIFVADGEGGMDQLIPRLPSSFLHLSSRFELLTESMIGKLPKSVISLDIKMTTGSTDFFNLPTRVSLLPSHLTALQLEGTFPCSTWPMLPSTLKTLAFLTTDDLCMVVSHTRVDPSTGRAIEIRTFPFELLPKSLTVLSISSETSEDSFCGPPSPSAASSYFPPSLSVLSLLTVQLSPEAAKQLPITLTHLRVANLCEKVCQHLPQGLIQLTTWSALVTPKLVGGLPRSLKKLYLAYAESRDEWYDDETGDPCRALERPEYDIHEHYGSKIDWKDGGLFPSNLSELTLRKFVKLGDSFFTNQLLPNLLSFDSVHSKHFTDLSIPLLSPNITSINLSSSAEISGKCFPFLPACLLSLRLDRSSSVFDSDIQHLPRTLNILSLNSAVDLTDACVPDLPRNLEWMSLKNSYKITPSSFPHFPIPLKSPNLRDQIQLGTWRIAQGQII